MDVDEARSFAAEIEAKLAPYGDGYSRTVTAVLTLADEVRRLSGLYEDAMLTLARVIAEREALDVELAKWRRA